MTEQEYIDATNLAKLRTMQLEGEIGKPLATWIAYLEKYGAKVRS